MRDVGRGNGMCLASHGLQSSARERCSRPGRVVTAAQNVLQWSLQGQISRLAIVMEGLVTMPGYFASRAALCRYGGALAMSSLQEWSDAASTCASRFGLRSCRICSAAIA